MTPLRLVIVDANAYWTEQLFSALAPEWSVFLVKPREFRDHGRCHHGRQFTTFVTEDAPGVRSLHVPMPPKFTTTGWPVARRLLIRTIKRVCGRPDVLVIVFPDYRALFEDLSPKRTLYYSYDDYGAHWPKRADSIVRAENQTVAAADVTVCIARQRAEDLKSRNPERASAIYHVPIGVTPAFMAGATADGNEPAGLAALPRPRAGYIGALSYRFDFPFLAEVAAIRPNVTFVLGGRPPERSQGDSFWWTGVKRARALPNVHFIGWVEHASLGQHLSSFDVLLMPYAECGFNRSSCPAKLWDYLGTGLPVVANTNNPETLDWREVVRIGGTPAQFAAAIDDALDEKRSAWDIRREARLAVARDHTWTRLADRLAPLLHSGLAPMNETQCDQTR